MHDRRKAREVALQVLYELDLAKTDVQEAVSLFWSHFTAPEEVFEPFWDYFDNPEDARKQRIKSFAVSSKAKLFSILLIEGAWQKRQELDKIISDCSEHWSISRMSKVDRSILRMAVYELLYCDDVPPKVTLNEAIDLGKTYGSENSGSFINGILDALYVKLQQTVKKPDKSGMKDGEKHE
ncbi:MAG: transcription antitermination factor NusB [Deltaproteobacteria bacterium HGW-Deltaproteobacteria-11]|nr:MAG: transcription antitermination factor NusB [Deltaproteobacteria bacterium HGW-Deltaproteobacteria-11]